MDAHRVVFSNMAQMVIVVEAWTEDIVPSEVAPIVLEKSHHGVSGLVIDAKFDVLDVVFHTTHNWGGHGASRDAGAPVALVLAVLVHT
jgi:hypothetical protein